MATPSEFVRKVVSVSCFHGRKAASSRPVLEQHCHSNEKASDYLALIFDIKFSYEPEMMTFKLNGFRYLCILGSLWHTQWGTYHSLWCVLLGRSFPYRLQKHHVRFGRGFDITAPIHLGVQLAMQASRASLVFNLPAVAREWLFKR